MKETTLTAKHKLNSAYVQGAAVVAGLIGLVTQSFVIFGIAIAVLLVAAIVARDIRR